MNTDCLIFDIDGTIWDTRDVCADAWNDALMASGINAKLTGSSIRPFFGLPLTEIAANLLKGTPFENESEDELKALVCVMTDYELRYIEKFGAVFYEGLEDTLKALSDKYPLAVVSNCQAGYAELMMKVSGFGKYFRLHLCPDDTGKLKAENIMLAAKSLGAKNPVYIGDTSMDEDASRKAGVLFIHAAYGFGAAKDPDAVIHTPSELLDIAEL